MVEARWRDARSAPELVEEIARESGQRLYLYSLDRFMEEAAKALRLDFSDEERDEVIAARLEDRFDPATADWQIDHELRQRAAPDRYATSPSEGHAVRFVPSPASGFVTYGAADPMGFPASRPGSAWQGTVREGPLGADLEIHWEPRPGPGAQQIHGRLTCIVTGPGGERASATETSAELSAYFRYPDDFRPLHHEAVGTHAFDWIFEAPGAHSSELVAAGTFELRGFDAAV